MIYIKGGTEKKQTGRGRNGVERQGTAQRCRAQNVNVETLSTVLMSKRLDSTTDI